VCVRVYICVCVCVNACVYVCTHMRAPPSIPVLGANQFAGLIVFVCSVREHTDLLHDSVQTNHFIRSIAQRLIPYFHLMHEVWMYDVRCVMCDV